RQRRRTSRRSMKPKEHAAPGFSQGQVQFWQTLVDQAYAGEGDLHDYDAAPRSVYKSKTDCSAAVKPVALVTTSPAPCSNLTELPDDVLVLVVSQLVGPPDRGRYTVLRPASSQKLQHRPSNVTGVQPASSGAAGPIHYAQQAGPVARAHSSSMVPRTVTSMGIATDPGLADVARLSMTCRRMREACKALLLARPDLSLQSEDNIRALTEKRRLVRRITLDQHGTYMKREVACELGGGSVLIGALTAGCAAWPGLCGTLSGTLNFLVFTLTHVLIHTALLAAAYRTAARVGARRALLLGLAAILLYYCVVVWAVQRLSGITQVPPHLNLEPWCRSGTCGGGPAVLLTPAPPGPTSSPFTHSSSPWTSYQYQLEQSSAWCLLSSQLLPRLSAWWHGSTGAASAPVPSQPGVEGQGSSPGLPDLLAAAAAAAGPGRWSTPEGGAWPHPDPAPLQPKSAMSAGVHSAGQLGGAAVAVPAHVSLPYYPLAVLIWPFFGVGLRWRLIHVLSNSFAWAYGVWEFRASYRYVKLRNGLWLNSPSRRLDK
ncbi:hypothetical protein QJQ45_017742, partial [Haematococcus lacustris]